MSDESTNPKNKNREASASNTPVALPPAQASPIAKPQSGLTDRTGWVIIGAMAIGACVLFLFGVNFVSKLLPNLGSRPIPTFTFAPTVLPNLTATQRAWVKPAQSPTLGLAAEVAPAIDSQNIEYLEMRATSLPSMPDINQPGDIYLYEINLLNSDELLWDYGWCTSTEEILAQNFRQMNVELRVNGTIVDQKFIASSEYERSDGGFCQSLTVLITDWPRGAHHLETRVTFLQPTDDGWNIYPAGTHIFQYFVYVEN